MKNAVEFAQEILRKERAINVTKSDKLKRDYRTSLHRDRGDLLYYCQCHNISVREVFEIARRGD
jgi:hypothetical protein